MGHRSGYRHSANLPITANVRRKYAFTPATGAVEKHDILELVLSLLTVIIRPEFFDMLPNKSTLRYSDLH